MMRKHDITHWFFMLAILLLATDSLALQAVLAVDEMTVLSNPLNAKDMRILVRYAVPESLMSAEILHAQLFCDIDATVGEGEAALEIESVPITRPWSSASASWTEPWTEAGGDVDRSLKGYYLVQRDAETARIDVTDLVVQWTRGERVNAGLMLKVSGIFRGTFSLPATAAGGGTARAPVIRIWYLPSIK